MALVGVPGTQRLHPKADSEKQPRRAKTQQGAEQEIMNNAFRKFANPSWDPAWAAAGGRTLSIHRPPV